MARLPIDVVSWPGFRIPDVADLAAPAQYHYDTYPVLLGDGAEWTPTGADLIIIEPGVSPLIVTIFGVPSAILRRDENLVINWKTADSSNIKIGPIPLDGFRQPSDGKIWMDVSQDCNVAVFRGNF